MKWEIAWSFVIVAFVLFMTFKSNKIILDMTSWRHHDDVSGKKFVHLVLLSFCCISALIVFLVVRIKLGGQSEFLVVVLGLLSAMFGFQGLMAGFCSKRLNGSLPKVVRKSLGVCSFAAFILCV
jgi:hypothetical protein